MLEHLQRLVETVRPGRDTGETAVQLRMLVAMAYADHRLGDVEASQLEDFVDRHARSNREHERLLTLLDELIAAPPSAEQVLEELVEHAAHRRMGARLVHELGALAGADASIDHREEFLLDLVCDTFGLRRQVLDPEDDASTALHELAHQLAQVTGRAA